MRIVRGQKFINLMETLAGPHFAFLSPVMKKKLLTEI